MPTYLRIDDTAIMSMMAPGGDVYDAHWGVTRNAANFARVFAPTRTGRLKRSIGTNRPKIIGPFLAQSMVYANVRHAAVVNEGHPGPILPKSGRFLAVPRSRNPSSGAELYRHWVTQGKPSPSLVTFKEAVRGQAAQKYLNRGVAAAMTEFRAGAG